MLKKAMEALIKSTPENSQPEKDNACLKVAGQIDMIFKAGFPSLFDPTDPIEKSIVRHKKKNKRG